MLDDGAWRDLFPLLSQEVDGKSVIYLDSAATALKPAAVIQAVHQYDTEWTANIHRGHHALSMICSEKYEAARGRMARFLQTSASNVVFTKNATEALNIVAAGFEQPGPVLCLRSDHHSNICSWGHHRAVHFVDGPVDAPVDLNRVEAAIKAHRPALLTFGCASNVSGVLQPVQDLCALAARHGVATCVDGAQSVPHLGFDFDGVGADFLALSGHKMLGPSGTGVLVGRAERLNALQPLVCGGGNIDRFVDGACSFRAPPHRFEGGTPNISGVLGLGAACAVLEQCGLKPIIAHGVELKREILAQVAKRPNLHWITGARDTDLPIVSLHLDDPMVTADFLASLLSQQYAIFARSGGMCAHGAFETGQSSVLRLSAYLYNTRQDIVTVFEAIDAILHDLIGG